MLQYFWNLTVLHCKLLCCMCCTSGTCCFPRQCRALAASLLFSSSPFVAHLAHLPVRRRRHRILGFLACFLSCSHHHTHTSVAACRPAPHTHHFKTDRLSMLNPQTLRLFDSFFQPVLSITPECRFGLVKLAPKSKTVTDKRHIYASTIHRATHRLARLKARNGFLQHRYSS